MSICLARLVQALKLESLEWNFEGLHTLRPLICMLCIICTCINAHMVDSCKLKTQDCWSIQGEGQHGQHGQLHPADLQE